MPAARQWPTLIADAFPALIDLERRSTLPVLAARGIAQVNESQRKELRSLILGAGPGTAGESSLFSPMVHSSHQAHAFAPSAAQSDALGELQPDQLRLLYESQWLKMLAPRDAGGGEWALPDVVRLEEAASQADGSCGWVLTLCAGAGWLTGFLPLALRQQIMATPQVCLAGSGAPTGYADRDGEGWRLNGQWRHASGAQLATHFTFNAQLREGGLPLLDAQGIAQTRAFVVPAHQVRLDRHSWHSIGMRASTSWSFSIENGYAQATQSFVMDAAQATASGPLYRFAFEALAWVTLGACMSGMARHFIALAQPLVSRHIAPLGSPSATALALWQKHHQAVEAARSNFYATLDGAWLAVASGQAPDTARTRELVDSTRTLVSLAREAVDAIYPCCSLYAADPRSEINRVWRDLHTATQHAIWLR